MSPEHMIAALARIISWKVHLRWNQTCWNIERTLLKPGGVSWRLFAGRFGVRLLRLEVEEARLSRDDDARLESLEIEELLLDVRDPEGL